MIRRVSPTQATMSAPMKSSGIGLDRNVYVNGEYLKHNPFWHVGDSAFKVSHILRIMEKNQLHPKTICDVGCGAGEVLKLLHDTLEPTCHFWGYDISPQALEMCKSRATARLQFRLGDISQEEGAFFDLMLINDVIEHVEDYLGFLNAIRAKSEWKVFHIPLDLSVQTVLRRRALLKRREMHRHLHYFTKETALESLKDVGYTVRDYFFTPYGNECGEETTQTLARLPRKFCFALHQDLTVRILGGYNLLVLAK